MNTQPPTPPGTMLTVEAMAVYFSTTNRAILARHARGKIPDAVRIGKRLYWHLDEIVAWREMRCPPSSTWHNMRLRSPAIRKRAKQEGGPRLPEELEL